MQLSPVNDPQTPKVVSIVLACYNIGRYLDECVESLMNQSLNRDTVEVVIVDDGSTDDTFDVSLRLKNKYPHNIIIKQQHNQGVSVARNAGIEMASGKYINFCDPDDSLGPLSLEDAADRLEENDDIDVVAMPMYYFEGRQGPHPLNRKFRDEFRVVDLEKTPADFQLSAATAMFRRSAIGDIRFPVGQVLGEDAYFVTSILLKTGRYGLSALARYNYRVRQDASNALASSSYSLDNQIQKLKGWMLPALRLAKKRLGAVPNFIYAGFAYDFCFAARSQQALLFQDVPRRGRYMRLALPILTEIPIRLIFSQTQMSHEEKVSLVQLVHGEKAEAKLRLVKGQPKIIIMGLALRDPLLKISRIEQVGDALTLTVQSHLYGSGELLAELDGVKLKVFRYRPSDAPAIVFGMPQKCLIGFQIRIPVGALQEAKSLKFFHLFNGEKIHFVQRYTKFSNPFLSLGKNAWIAYGLHFRISDDGLDMAPAERRKIWAFEKEHVREMSKKGFVKAAVLRGLLALKKRRPGTAVFMDRPGKAGDSAEVLLRHYNANPSAYPAISEAVFVLDRKSSDWRRLSSEFNLVRFGSLKHKYALLNADWLISTHADENIFYPDIEEGKWLFDQLKAKRIFLQHGVIHLKDVSSWLHKNNKNFWRFITSVQHERDTVASARYGYASKEVVMSGLPRFDRLAVMNPTGSRSVLITPTWRKNVVDELNALASGNAVAEYVKNNRYFQDWLGLKTAFDKLFTERGVAINTKIIWHPAIAKSLSSANLEARESNIDYAQEITDSVAVITDFSSLVYDAVFVGKPVAFFGVDTAVDHGINDLKRNRRSKISLGPTFDQVDDLKKWMEERLAKNFSIEDEYAINIGNMFSDKAGASDRVLRSLN